MIISSIELREINLPLVHFFETSFGRTTERRIVLVRVVDQDGAEGWGECTAGEGPFYSDEWTDTAWSTLSEFLGPMVVGKEINSAAETWDLMKPVRGHRMAKAAIETACWDLEAKRADIPLWKYLGGMQTEIPCGVSIGIQDSAETLIAKIEEELAAGYQRIKIKLKPGWDLNIVEQVRNRFPDIRLMGDANSAYTLADVPLFRNLDEFNLMMVEQPLAHNDIFDHAELQRQIRTPVCLDESIHSAEDAAHATELGSCRIINVKLGRVGGHAEAKRIESMCRERKIPVWCGGMLESGIGRAHNIAMATLPGFTLPGDVSASARYWNEDIIEPPVAVTSRGTISAPEKSGIGYEINMQRLKQVTVRTDAVTARDEGFSRFSTKLGDVFDAVCKRPQDYTFSGSFGETLGLLDGYANGRKFGSPGRSSSYFNQFAEWLRINLGWAEDWSGPFWVAFRNSYPDDATALQDFARFWHEYEQRR